MIEIMLTTILTSTYNGFETLLSLSPEGLMTEFPDLELQAKTHAITPDKMDRSSRKTEGNNLPYPLTEEEATPHVPISNETW
jgi:hypothetical protein